MDLSTEKKSFYTMSDIHRVTSIPQHVLRYWEKRIPQLQPKRNQANRRVYTHEQLHLILHIQKLIQQDGLTIDGVCKQLDKDLDANSACNPAEVDYIIHELESILAEADE